MKLKDNYSGVKKIEIHAEFFRIHIFNEFFEDFSGFQKCFVLT